jgi:hypothetical protein
MQNSIIFTTALQEVHQTKCIEWLRALRWSGNEPLAADSFARIGLRRILEYVTQLRFRSRPAEWSSQIGSNRTAALWLDQGETLVHWSLRRGPHGSRNRRRTLSVNRLL